MAQTISTMACEAMDLLERKKPTSREFALWIVNHFHTQKLTIFLGHNFKDLSFLKQAFTHSSFAHEFPHLHPTSNERLEFLGDTILQTLVTVMIMEEYPDFSEGHLSKLRASLVNEKALASLAQLMELGNVVLLGRGEIKCKGIQRDALLANLFESVLGAVFCDGGYNTCQKVFKKIIREYQKAFGKPFITLERLEDFDSKSRLQEHCMAIYGRLPQYQEKKIDDGFQVALTISGKLFGPIMAPSKKQAQQILARQALDQLR